MRSRSTRRLNPPQQAVVSARRAGVARWTGLALCGGAVIGALASAPARAQERLQETAEGGVAAELGVRLETVAQAEAAIFVLENYLREDNDLNALAAQYADTVVYYDLGAQPIQEIIEDKENYVRRWPVRRFTADLDTLRVIDVDEGAMRVEVQVDFDVANSDRAVSGRSLIQITVARRGAGLRIVGESGRVLSRR